MLGRMGEEGEACMGESWIAAVRTSCKRVSGDDDVTLTHTHTHTDRQTNRHTHTHTHTQTNRQTDRHTHLQAVFDPKEAPTRFPVLRADDIQQSVKQPPLDASVEHLKELPSDLDLGTPESTEEGRL